jgi:sigma-B regulation protein RsbU (phosphoserine phosphatase)
MQLAPELFQQLQEIEKVPFRGPGAAQRLGSLVREVLLSRLPIEAVTIYLPVAPGTLSRVAGDDDGPDTLDPSALSDPSTREELLGVFAPPMHALIPIAGAKETLGALAVRGRSELDAGDRDALGAVGAFLSAFLSASRMATEIREGDFQLRYHLWELESLYDIGLSIASMLDLAQLGDEILMRTMSLVNARRAALYLRQGERFALHQSLGGARAQFLDDEIKGDDAKHLLVDGEPLTFEAKADCIFPGCESLVAMPIRSNEGTVIGVLSAADREFRDGSVGGFEEGEIRLLSRFANQVSIAIQNARLHREALDKQAIERDLELAATIQKNIFPRALPSLEGYEIAVLSNPARQLGGDYHAFFEHDGKVSCCVADVSGKSVPAAILVSALHAALQLLFHEGRELGDIAIELNRHIHKWSTDSKFVTLVLATIDRKEGVIRYVNAGHNPAYVAVDGAIETLPSHGLPVGIMGGSKYVTQTRPFARGSLLALYSDGITEAVNSADEEFGPERLLSILLENASDSTLEIRDRVSRAVEEFAGDEPQYDDQTLVLIRTH